MSFVDAWPMSMIRLASPTAIGALRAISRANPRPPRDGCPSRHHAIHQPDTLSFGRFDHARGHDEFLRSGIADGARQPHGPADVGHKTDTLSGIPSLVPVEAILASHASAIPPETADVACTRR